MYKLSVIIPVYNQENLVIRAIESIPKRKDIEIIVIDDASTDNTWNVLQKYQEENDNFILLYNEENKGVGYTVNKGYDNARGEYVVLLGSDDYFYTEELNKMIDDIDDTDLIYFNLKINNGDIWDVNEKSKTNLCGSVKFMKRSFIGDTRCPEIRYAEDKAFYEKLLEKHPTEKFTHKVVKHYNFPRIDSLCDLKNKGVL